MVISYLTLRKWIGIIAMAFPVLLILGGGFPMQTSISAYYWTTAGDLFVGMLVMLAIFLMTYRGYDARDTWITSIAGVAMLGVALFPCEGSPVPNYLFMFIPVKVSAVIHYIMAGITFAMMGVMSAFQFTKIRVYSVRRLKRRILYQVCGYVIFIILGFAILLELIPRGREDTDSIRLWFWMESMIVWLFGISWLVKGGTLWRDGSFEYRP